MVDLAIIGTEVEEQPLVVTEEPSRVLATVIPDQSDDPSRTENAYELLPRKLGIEPVEGLSGYHQVDTVISERRVLGRPGNTPKPRKAGEQSLCSTAHLGVGFDAVDSMAAFEEESAEDSGPRADVGDRPVGMEPAFLGE